jgi:hypothetical protein
MLVANLSAKDGKPADINDLPEHVDQSASQRVPFDYLLLIDSDLLTRDESDCLRPRVYEELARGAGEDRLNDAPVRFAKVHDAYMLTSKGEPLLAGRLGADGAILIVRDPRDVAVSFASYRHISIDRAITLMENEQHEEWLRADRVGELFRQRTLGWSGHAKSWLNQTDIPVHLVRYEDMKADTVATFRRALDFSGYPASDEDVRRAVGFADFAELRRQERNTGFRERSLPGVPFFRRGENGGWRDELSTEQVARIEAVHGAMMRRLGYEPTGAAVTRAASGGKTIGRS